MSLRIWLPLTGNLNNNGIDGSVVTNYNVTFDTNGKLGSCALISTAGNKLTIPNPITSTSDEFSISCWFYITQFTNGYACLCCDRTQTSGKGLAIWIQASAMRIDTDEMWAFSETTNLNTWYHFCFTWSKSKGKYVYINGEQVAYKESVGLINNITSTLWIAESMANATGNYSLVGKLNDFRIYDHALSVKEVKELAKGLVVHYPLNNNGYDIPNMVDHSDNFEGWTTTGTGWTKSVSDDGSTIYSFSRTGATSSIWYRLIPDLQIDGNNYPNGVTVSLDLYTSDVSAINQKCIGSLQTYQEDGTRIGWREPGWDLSGVVNGKWTRISSFFAQNYLITKNGTPTATYAYTMFSFQLVQNGDISIRRIKIEPGDRTTPYSLSLNDINDNSVYDISGYNNHANIVGSPTISSNSIRNNTCTHFTTNQYIIGQKLASAHLPKNALTVNIWINCTSWGNPISCTEGGGWNFESGTEGYIRFPVCIDGGIGYKYKESLTKTSDVLNGWHMLTGTFDGANIKMYVDGELQSDISTGSTYGIKCPNNYLCIAAEASGSGAASSTYVGDISDVRIYATALSADDIKELYNIPISLSDSGYLYTQGEYDENTDISFGKNGIIKSDNLYESHSLNQFNGSNDISFTPTTANNSCLQGWGNWFVPEGAVAGDTFRIRFNIEYENFDASSTAGTFNIRFQGANYTTPTTSVWAGTNPICVTLNNTQSLKTLVLSSTKGSFVYETLFTLTQEFLDEYIGSNLSIRSDYSNGTAKLRITNTEIIPEKYSITDDTKLKLGNNYISTNEFIEI